MCCGGASLSKAPGWGTVRCKACGGDVPGSRTSCYASGFIHAGWSPTGFRIARNQRCRTAMILSDVFLAGSCCSSRSGNTHTLSSEHCNGGLVLWVRGYFAKNTLRLGLMRCADQMVRVTHALLRLQLLEVALWAGFYRWKSNPGDARQRRLPQHD